jgi:tRNA uridine 5-carboxymethylaminomethyl modification enzyme
MGSKNKYDIIVIGGGHAGCEAAAAGANLGSDVALITMKSGQFAQMSCNPSMGGVAKGQIVREVDALGGLSGIVTDKTMVQFRMLNRSKGPAMWSPRAQNDRVLFSKEWKKQLDKISKIEYIQDTVEEIIVKDDQVFGVKTSSKKLIKTKAVIICSGTFLNGVIHIGEVKFEGGRMGDASAKNLTKSLIGLGFKSDRMKTGTPVRVDGTTIDFSVLSEQKGDEDPGNFSFIKRTKIEKQKSCWLAYTSPEVHEVLRKGFDKSPMFQGRIKGRGPRYCPSIEDKIERFSHRERHQLFVEPEGWNTTEYYINGFSSSLPAEIQYEALGKIKGFEKTRILKPGYAIEYDYFPPEQLKNNLETKKVENLFFAGQINGTTGYEEAAAQGIMAGINAHLKITGKDIFVLKRSEAYIGVLIDDLITKGVNEPYRMFTSRAEYRILLRQDNADQRLTEKSYQIGLASRRRFGLCEEKVKKIRMLKTFIEEQSVSPEEANGMLLKKNTAEINQKTKLENLLLRPQIFIDDIVQHLEVVNNFLKSKKIFEKEIFEEAEIEIKYQSYMKKEEELAKKIAKMEDIVLFENLEYEKLRSLSAEAREKLSRIRPMTIGQASRIAGVSPADISVLLVYLGR